MAPIYPTYEPESYSKCGRFSLYPTNVCTKIVDENGTRSMDILCSHGTFTRSYYDNVQCSVKVIQSESLACRGSDYVGCVCNNDYICDYAKFRDYYNIHSHSGCGNDSNEYAEIAIIRDTCFDMMAGDNDNFAGMAYGCDQENSELMAYPCGDWTGPDINFTNLISNFSVIAKPLNESGRGRFGVCDLQCFEGSKMEDGLSNDEIIGIVVGCVVGAVLIGVIVLVVMLKGKDQENEVNDLTSDNYESVEQTDEE